MAVIRTVAHERVEDRGLIRMIAQIVEIGLTVDGLKRAAAGMEGVPEGAPRRPIARRGPVASGIVQRGSGVTTQPARARRVRQVLAGIEREDAVGRERAAKAKQRASRTPVSAASSDTKRGPWAIRSARSSSAALQSITESWNPRIIRASLRDPRREKSPSRSWWAFASSRAPVRPCGDPAAHKHSPAAIDHDRLPTAQWRRSVGQSMSALDQASRRRGRSRPRPQVAG